MKQAQANVCLHLRTVLEIIHRFLLLCLYNMEFTDRYHTITIGKERYLESL